MPRRRRRDCSCTKCNIQPGSACSYVLYNVMVHIHVHSHSIPVREEGLAGKSRSSRWRSVLAQSEASTYVSRPSRSSASVRSRVTLGESAARSAPALSTHLQTARLSARLAPSPRARAGSPALAGSSKLKLKGVTDAALWRPKFETPTSRAGRPRDPQEAIVHCTSVRPLT